MTPRLLPMLSENWARTSDRDLRAPVPIAAETDKAGIDGIAGPFPAPDAVADPHEALREPPVQLAAGIGTICVKPSRYPGDARQARAFVGRLPELIA